MNVLHMHPSCSLCKQYVIPGFFIALCSSVLWISQTHIYILCRAINPWSLQVCSASLPQLFTVISNEISWKHISIYELWSSPLCNCTAMKHLWEVPHVGGHTTLQGQKLFLGPSEHVSYSCRHLWYPLTLLFFDLFHFCACFSVQIFYILIF